MESPTREGDHGGWCMLNGNEGRRRKGVRHIRVCSYPIAILFGPMSMREMHMESLATSDVWREAYTQSSCLISWIRDRKPSRRATKSRPKPGCGRDTASHIVVCDPFMDQKQSSNTRLGACLCQSFI